MSRKLSSFFFRHHALFIALVLIVTRNDYTGGC